MYLTFDMPDGIVPRAFVMGSTPEHWVFQPKEFSLLGLNKRGVFELLLRGEIHEVRGRRLNRRKHVTHRTVQSLVDTQPEQHSHPHSSRG